MGKYRRHRNQITGLAILLICLVLVLAIASIKGQQMTDLLNEKKLLASTFAAAKAQKDCPAKIDLLRTVLKKQLGKPYIYGANGPRAFDCSGLVQYTYKMLGQALPRTAAAQAKAGKRVTLQALRSGDLVFFSNNGSTITHVGIYIGNGYMVHAPKTGEVVSISRIDTGYYAKTFHKAVRVIN